MRIEIEPKIITKELVKFVIDSVNVSIEEKATISYHFEDENFNGQQGGSLVIEGEEYKEWGKDDAYLVALCLQKLNLVRKVQ